MAGDWIKMRTNLLTDPSVVAICSLTSLDEFAVIGRLHTFWSWADQHTRNGYAANVTPKWVDKFLRHDGFSAALLAVDWLKVDDNGVRVPRFDKHNGQSAKSRALARERMAAKRLREGDAANVTKAQPEKRRGSSREEFDSFWSSYPRRDGRRRGKEKTFGLFRALSAEDQKLAIVAAKNYADSGEAKRNYSRDPERFLKADWWRDWLGVAESTDQHFVATDEDLANYRPHSGGG